MVGQKHSGAQWSCFSKAFQHLVFEVLQPFTVFNLSGVRPNGLFPLEVKVVATGVVHSGGFWLGLDQYIYDIREGGSEAMSNISSFPRMFAPHMILLIHVKIVYSRVKYCTLDVGLEGRVTYVSILIGYPECLAGAERYDNDGLRPSWGWWWRTKQERE